MPPLRQPEKLAVRLEKAAENATWLKGEEARHGELTGKVRGILSRHSATEGGRIDTTQFVATGWVDHPTQPWVRLRLSVPERGNTVGVPEGRLEIEVPDPRRNGAREVFPLASFGVGVNHTHEGDTLLGTGTAYHEDGLPHDDEMPPAVPSSSGLFGDISDTIDLIGDHFDANPLPGTIAAIEAGGA